MMKPIAVIVCLVAVGIFLIQEFTVGTIEDAMLDATGKVVDDSPIDPAIKTSLKGTFMLIGLLGTLATIAGVIALLNKHF